MSFPSRRILVVAPVFHGYSRAVTDALGRQGNDVRLWHYDDHSGARAKLRLKLGHELPAKAGVSGVLERERRRVTTQAIAALRAESPDIVLAIKADTIGPEFWAEVRHQGATSHLWLYDEIRRSTHAPEVLDSVDILSSYSRGDVATLRASGLDVSYLPNAFDADLADVAPVLTPAFLFIGARYGFREEFLRHLADEGLPILAVGRGWSHHPVDRLRTWELRRPDLPALRDHSRSDSYALMAGALGNLNVHHNQDGFTMRTFEIPGMGGLQFIDRTDVGEFYEPGSEVLVYTSPDELVDLAHRAQRERSWARAIGERGRRRTLAEHTFDHRAAQVQALWR